MGKNQEFVKFKGNSDAGSEKECNSRLNMDAAKKSDHVESLFRYYLQKGGGGDNQSFSDLYSKSVNKEQEKIADHQINDKGASNLPNVDVKNLAKWEKHTKGFGKKMLEKMGFKGRLGKDGSGISAPVAVKVRPNQLGLGFGDFQEAGNLAENRKIEKELHGLESSESSATEDDEFDEGNAVNFVDKKYWKVDNFVQPDTRLVYPKQVLNVYATAVHGALKNDAESESNAENGIGKEILYNLNYLIKKSETQVRDGGFQISDFKERKVVAEKEYEQVCSRLEKDQLEMNNIQCILDVVKNVKSILVSEDAIMGLKWVLKEVMSLQEKYPFEYKSLQLNDLLPCLAMPVLKKQILLWQPLAKYNGQCSNDDDMIEMLLLAKKIVQHGTIPHDDESFDLNHQHEPANLSNCTSQMEKLIVSRVGTIIVADWDVQSQICTPLFKTLKLILPSHTFQKLLETSILPKLRMQVEIWDAVSDPIHVHTWLSPWELYLPSQVSTLYEIIKSKLGKCLQHWKITDTSAYELIQPWQSIWTSKHFQIFIEQHITPKLVSQIIDKPLDVALFTKVKIWLPLLPYCDQFLNSTLFPKYLESIYEFITKQNPNKAQIKHYYDHWQLELLQAIPETVVYPSTYPAICLIKQIYVDNLPVPESLPFPKNTSYEAVVKQASVKPAEKVPTLKAKSAKVTYFDVVQQAAIDGNLKFTIDSKRKTIDSHKALLFGTISLYIAQSVIYAQVGPGNEYLPIELSSLVQYAKKQ